MNGTHEGVVAAAERFARDQAVSAEQRRLLDAAFGGLRAHLGHDAPSSVRVPLLVYAAVQGDARPAVPLAVAATLLFTGVDLLDDVMDGGLPGHWHGFLPAEILLAATTLISALPQRALVELEAPAETIVAMQRTLARGCMVMSAGQQADVAMAGRRDVSTAAVEAAVMRKSGEAWAMLATMAAQLAGAPAAAVERFAAMGRALGTARQLRSDCTDLFGAPDSRDLANGTRTLPLALYLQHLPPAKVDAFLGLLDEARTDPLARAAVRGQVLTAGILRECAVIIELYCECARDALARAGPRAPAVAALRGIIDGNSFFTSDSRPAKGKGVMA